MTDYSHDDLLGLAGAYALGATSPDETRAIEDAMESSPALAAEVNAHRSVVADMIAAQLTVPPSADVRARLLESVAPRRLPGTGRNVALLVAAASVLVAAGLAFQLTRTQREMRAMSQQLARRDATISSFLGAEKDLRVLHLRAADTLVGPGIQLFWDSRHRVGLMHAFRLPPAPAGEVYQLWAVIDDAPVSVRVFDSSPSGHAILEGIPLPANAKGLTRMLLTVEPKGGSRAPTSAPLLGGVPSTN
ncbi:MAG: anti-sigma factor [Gemmatimonadaceae bacterium]